jgi:hypothetical protein
MAGNTFPRRTVVTGEVLFFDMTAAAQVVELFFDKVCDFVIGFVAIETQTATGVVDEIVVARHALLIGVVDVSKADREHAAGGVRHDLFVGWASVLPRCDGEQQAENAS